VKFTNWNWNVSRLRISNYNFFRIGFVNFLESSGIFGLQIVLVAQTRNFQLSVFNTNPQCFCVKNQTRFVYLHSKNSDVYLSNHTNLVWLKFRLNFNFFHTKFVWFSSNCTNFHKNHTNLRWNYLCTDLSHKFCVTTLSDIQIFVRIIRIELHEWNSNVIYDRALFQYP
jgi:hypothetical protein